MTDQSTPIIELAGVGKSYANINALKDVSLKVRQGEVTCILGDNGAGKSTLISIIAGLIRHDHRTAIAPAGFAALDQLLIGNIGGRRIAIEQ